MKKNHSAIFVFIILILSITLPQHSTAEKPITQDQVKIVIRKAAVYFKNNVANHGGYVYHYTEEVKSH